MNQIPDIGQGWLEALEQISPCIDIASGYRTRALEAGFSSEAAEIMSLEFHHALMGKIMGLGE